MRLRKITLREIHLRLLSPFQTSFGTSDLRRILLVEADIDGIAGWGESTAGENPFYSYETVETAWLILRDYLVADAEGQGNRVSSRSMGSARARSRTQHGQGRVSKRFLGCRSEAEKYAARETARRHAR